MTKLTKTERARLHEIGQDRNASCGDKPATTKKLIALGLVAAQGGKIAKTGRIMGHAQAVLTAAGLIESERQVP